MRLCNTLRGSLTIEAACICGMIFIILGIMCNYSINLFRELYKENTRECEEVQIKVQDVLRLTGGEPWN